MKQILNVVIEIESNCTHSVRNIEEALNFFWGSDGEFKVVEAVEHGVHPTGGTCPGHVAPVVNGYCFDCGLPRSTSG